MNIWDSGPLSGATILAFLSAALTYATRRLQAANNRRLKKAQSIPPTEGLEPPAPSDRAVLERLDRAEQHDAIVAALFRTQGELVDERRKNEVLRDANNKLSLEVYALKTDNERKDTQLRAERLTNRTLRDQLSHVEKELAEKTAELELAHADLRRALLVKG